MTGRCLINGGDALRAVVEDLGVEVEEMEEEAAAMEVVSRILVGAAIIGDGRGDDDVRRH